MASQTRASSCASSASISRTAASNWPIVRWLASCNKIQALYGNVDLTAWVLCSKTCLEGTSHSVRTPRASLGEPGWLEQYGNLA